MSLFEGRQRKGREVDQKMKEEQRAMKIKEKG